MKICGECKRQQVSIVTTGIAFARSVLLIFSACERHGTATQISDASFAKDVRRSQATAMDRHPALATADSDFNQRFRSRLEEWRARSDLRLNSSDWPEVLADDLASNP